MSSDSKSLYYAASLLTDRSGRYHLGECFLGVIASKIKKMFVAGIELLTSGFGLPNWEPAKKKLICLIIFRNSCKSHYPAVMGFTTC
jgi:hypothetical protein